VLPSDIRDLFRGIQSYLDTPELGRGQAKVPSQDLVCPTGCDENLSEAPFWVADPGAVDILSLFLFPLFLVVLRFTVANSLPAWTSLDKGRKLGSSCQTHDFALDKPQRRYLFCRRRRHHFVGFRINGGNIPLWRFTAFGSS